MRAVICEIKKCMSPSLVLFSAMGVAAVCFFGEGYSTADGKSYTIMELFLFADRSTLLTDISMNRYSMWVQGLGTWSRLLMPFLLGVGYLYAISEEKQTGFRRMVLIRENNLRYVASKLLSAVICGGVIIFAGYILYGALIYMRFPPLSGYSAADLEMFLEINAGFNEPLFFLRRCLSVFLYGMCLNVFAYLVSVFFTDRYILMCLPLMLKYVFGQLISKVESDAMVSGNDGTLNLCAALSMETLLDQWGSVYCAAVIMLTVFLYIAGFFLMLRLLKMGREATGFE